MKKAVTLVELLVSLIILALIMLGLANIFFTSRRFITLNRSRTQAAQFSKTMLDNFSGYVRQDLVDDAGNPLCVSGSCNPTDKTGDSSEFNYIIYNSTYNVSNLSTAGDMRKVKMVVNWTEPVD